jgi:cytochrome c oxidase subunit 2
MPRALGLAVLFADAIGPESGGSPNADNTHTLWIIVLIIALIVLIGVEGLLLYTVIRFRARKHRMAAQIHGNTRLEIGWTVGAFLILIFITVFTFVTLPGIKDPARSDIDANGNAVAAAQPLYASTDQPPPPKGSASMNITVIGQQYVWQYNYPGRERVFSYVDMVVPVGMTITLDIRADDVIHSWWIPKLGGKMDAVPGYTNKTWFKIPPSAIKPGQKQVVYNGQCAELCGRNHANMLGRVIGMRYPDYKAWYDQKVAQIKQAREQAAKTRQQINQEQGG